jgi:ABC-type transport system involved in multi-copper enzyme maturation permease subunit
MKIAKKFIGNAKFLILLVVLSFCLALNVMSLDALYNHKMDTMLACLMLSAASIFTVFIIDGILSLIYKGE